MKRIWLFLSVLLVLALATFDLVAQPQEGGRLVWGLYEEPSSLDPTGSTLAVQHMINDHIFEHLCDFADDGTLQPLLCESWSVSEDGLVWDVILKEGITFHDGKPVTAADWAYSFDRTRDIGPRSGFYAPVDQYIVVNDYTLRITLKYPFPRILEILTLGDAYLVDEATVEAMGDTFGVEAPLNGTGPYKLKEWVRGEYILLERWEAYAHGPAWRSNPGPAYVEEVMFRVLHEDSTRVFELTQGNVDITPFVPFSLYNVAQSAPSIQLEERVRDMTYLLGMNTKRAPLDDVMVRWAIAMAVEREPIVQVALTGHGDPAYIMCSPAQLGFPKDSYGQVRAFYPPENQDRARMYLRTVGWIDEDGDGVLEKDGEELRLILWAQTGAEWPLMAQILQNQLAEVGIAIEIISIETGTFYGALNTGEHDLYLGMSGYPFALDYLPFRHHTRSIGGSNPSFYDVELASTIDRLLDIAQVLPTEAERYEALAEALKFIGEASAYVPLAWPVYPVAWKKDRVGGVEGVLESIFGTQVDFTVLDCLEYYIKQ
jgi:peptide/nickel transport system substrate-binding protein